LLEGIPGSIVTETLAGSARRALKVKPPFHHFIFNEMHAARRAALQKILTENPDRDIEILDTDANAALCQIFGRSSWAFKDQGKARGVVFHDSYALQVDWSTLYQHDAGTTAEFFVMVQLGGLEPPTSCSTDRRSNQLSYNCILLRGPLRGSRIGRKLGATHRFGKAVEPPIMVFGRLSAFTCRLGKSAESSPKSS
jgi:three-Cys-motif partner protein